MLLNIKSQFRPNDEGQKVEFDSDHPHNPDFGLFNWFRALYVHPEVLQVGAKLEIGAYQYEVLRIESPIFDLGMRYAFRESAVFVTITAQICHRDEWIYAYWLGMDKKVYLSTESELLQLLIAQK